MNKQLVAMSLAALAAGAQAHDFVTEAERVAAIDVDNVEVRSEPLGPGLYVLFGLGGNVVVSIGDQGVLMVDSQYAPMVPLLKGAISELGGGEIDFTINTHWHYDHVGGNPFLGREGTWFVSHQNSRRMLAGEHVIDTATATPLVQSAYPDAAMPVITYKDEMQLHFNGDTLDLLHFGPAHTTGDTAVIFRDANVVHMGDVLNAGYPFIDAGNGGGIDGMILFCEKVLAHLDEDSRIVPGHGAVLGYDDMVAYIAMLETIRNRISDMIDAGKTLDEVIAATPTAEFDDRYGDPVRLINRAYMSLSR
jgi:glyoxylase-like metal-dependent hydrolase (beta-lactamase superfamily II)